MEALLEMPLPFAAALVILAIVGAISFLQFIVLMLSPTPEVQMVRANSARERQIKSGRRAADRYSGNNAVLS